MLIIESENDGQDTRHDGITIDISEHGARIEAEAVLAPGHTLNLIQPDDPTRSLRCVVVWAGDVDSDGHDQMGLEFLGPSPSALEN